MLAASFGSATAQIVTELEPEGRGPASASPPAAEGRSNSKARPPQVELAYTTPTSKGDAWGPLWGESVQFPKEQRHSKLVYLFDRALQLRSIRIESCREEFVDTAEVWLDHMRKSEVLEGGRSKLIWNLENTSEKVQSISLGFRESHGVCLSKVEFVTDPPLQMPKWVRLNQDSVGPWADGVPMAEGPDRGMLSLSEEVEFDGIRIWVGDHLPMEAWSSGGRPNEVELRVPGVKIPIVIPLRETRFAQEFRFADLVAGNSPWATGVKARQITLSLRGVQSGTSEQPLARNRARISEVQLMSRSSVTPIVLRSDRIQEPDDVKAWRAVDFAKILDRELKSDEKEGDEATWRFRFRSDGTFFAANAAWSSQGRWRVLGQPSSDGLKLELKGGKWRTPRPSDSVPCASRCHPLDQQRGIASQLRTQAGELSVNEVVEIQKFNRARWIIRNRQALASRSLDFADVRLRVNSLLD